MLERPQSRKQKRRARDARYRRRLREGKIVVSIEVDGSVIDLLVRIHQLLERDSTNAKEIASAIKRTLAASAQL
jgi:hypothetical protein